MLSTLMLIMAVAPLLGPIVGGQILLVGSWRAIFWCLTAVGALSVVGVILIDETLPDGPARPGTARRCLEELWARAG